MASVSGKEESDNYIHYLDTIRRARDEVSYDIHMSSEVGNRTYASVSGKEESDN